MSMFIGVCITGVYVFTSISVCLLAGTSMCGWSAG